MIDVGSAHVPFSFTLATKRILEGDAMEAPVLVINEMAVAARAMAEETPPRFADSLGHCDNTLDPRFRGKIGELVGAQ